MQERGGEPPRRRLLRAVRSLLGNLRRRGRGEDGFTLIELLIASALGVVVIGSAITILVAALRSEPATTERNAEIQQARVLMERMTRELRQGAAITTQTPTQITLVTYVNSATCGGPSSQTARLCQVTYTCAGGTCSRLERDTNGSGAGAARTEVTGLSGDPVFAYSGDSRFVAITLEFPAADGDDDSITLRDGVTLRNPAAPAT